MLDLGLAASAALMGLAGTPHCLAMCGAACSAAGGGRSVSAGFQLGRLLGYAAAGAAAAAGVQLLGQLGEASALLRPLWVLVHAAALLLGLALLWRGRQPAWLENLGQGASRQFGAPAAALRAGGVALAAPSTASLRSGLIGLAWVAWPCGLLQSALLVAALASGPLAGAGVMSAFALCSGAGLALGPLLLARSGIGPHRGPGLAVRLGGLGLAAASAWALGQGLWQQIEPYCR
ncbi:sulfite exporter TauE/SafE family protein [Roseateles violae]|uniref:Sulfite exporter TauE/SafE family protein n=1 Tax=Roseateles violae TaxID=3058042 RepID=A0ABT8DXD1_9BURK|nr:sulfite exporter TauE/SafE family protein [Pelomonas sp. PFR6]MDN3922035.1 sulfite exporter TauE/SafE family protein [Pelomonas sp. PFR6]